MEHEKLYRDFLASPFLHKAEKAELAALPAEEIRDRFYKTLDFGTAGLRGVYGAGLNRLNVLTMAQALRAAAETLSPGDTVVVCRDARLSSRELAEAAACVFAAKGFRVLYFKDPRPTPELSFAARRYGAFGINITASHNPPEYNGCKLYGRTGAQLDTEQTDRIAALMPSFPVLSRRPTGFARFVRDGRISYIDEDENYISSVLSVSVEPGLLRSPMRVVYSAFCGVGGAILPKAFQRAGVRGLFCEKTELRPNGRFPGLASPNPENPAGFRRSAALAAEKDAELILATDPDADRMAACVRRGDKFIPLSGNEMGILLSDYLISAKKRAGTLPRKACIIKTVVTTPLIDEMCEKNGVSCYSTFTGFKNMAKKLSELTDESCLLCFEESIGYMANGDVRDKDGISAALLLLEAAAYHKKHGRTLLDALDGIYAEYGRFEDKTGNLVCPGESGLIKMQGIMRRLREKPPRELCGVRIDAFLDYLTGENTELSGSDVLELRGSFGRVLIRPSGTEPKIKFYALTKNHSADALLKDIMQYAERDFL